MTLLKELDDYRAKAYHQWSRKDTRMVKKVESRVDTFLFRTLLLTMMLIGHGFYSSAFAQNYMSTIKTTQQLSGTVGEYLEESHVYINKRVDLTFKEKHSNDLVPPIINYFVKTDGKILLYSGGHGAVQIEIGLSGYLGVRWLF